MSSFFSELRRRKVVNVAVACAIVAWLLIQIIVSDDLQPQSEETSLVFVENWFEELNRLAPPDSAETP